jgi:hypothetical protein
MEILAGSNPLDYGIVGIILLVIWKMLGVAQTLFLSKRIEPAPCLKFHQQIEEIHKMTEATERQKSEGKFGCRWVNRDEVVNSIASHGQHTEALQVLTAEIKELTRELRLTRNGGHAKI